jgi:hypothetical protein
MAQLVVIAVIGLAALAATIILIYWAINLSSNIEAVRAALGRIEAAQAADASDPEAEAAEPPAEAAEPPEAEAAASTAIDIEPFVD